MVLGKSRKNNLKKMDDGIMDGKGGRIYLNEVMDF